MRLDSNINETRCDLLNVGGIGKLDVPSGAGARNGLHTYASRKDIQRQVYYPRGFF